MLLCLVERSGASLSVFNFVKEAGTLLIIAGAAGFVKLFEQFLLLGGKIAGDFNGDFDVLIAPTLSLQMLYAFFLQFEDVTGLGAGMNLVADLAVQGRYDDLVTKGSLRKGDGNFAPDIVAFPLEDFVLFDVDVDVLFNEVNEKNINMQYKLKNDGKYLLGSVDNYETIAGKVIGNITIPANGYESYVLDWKWVDSSNDAEVGFDVNSFYKLSIKVATK